MVHGYIVTKRYLEEEAQRISREVSSKFVVEPSIDESLSNVLIILNTLPVMSVLDLTRESGRKSPNKRPWKKSTTPLVIQSYQAALGPTYGQ